MSTQALFEGLIFDEEGQLVATAVVGSEANYVINDDGFHRHISAADIDRQVLAIFLEQLNQNHDLAVEQTLKMIGKDDLMTKAAIEASLKNVDMDQIIAQGIPAQARNMLAMMGFRIIINFHGDIINIEQPQSFDDED